MDIILTCIARLRITKLCLIECLSGPLTSIHIKVVTVRAAFRAALQPFISDLFYLLLLQFISLSINIQASLVTKYDAIHLLTCMV